MNSGLPRRTARARAKALAVTGIALIAMVAAGACSEREDGEAGAAEQELTLRLGHTAPPGNDQFVAAEEFARLASRETDGNLTVKVFPNSQLGTEEDMLKKVQQGALDAAILSTTVTANAVPAVGVFDLPYLFDDYEQTDAAFTGPGAEATDEALLEEGFRSLGYQYIGFRSTLCKDTKIAAPDYFKGVSIRVPGSPVALDTFERFGAQPDPLPYNEAFTALQTGVVECVETAPQSLYNSKFYEVAKQMTMTKHMFGALVMLVNERRFSALPDEYQQALVRAGSEANRNAREANPKTEAKALADLKSEGVRVADVDLGPLREQVAPLYDEFGDKVGDPDLVATVRGTE